jgi:hypothetical protein
MDNNRNRNNTKKKNINKKTENVFKKYRSSINSNNNNSNANNNSNINKEIETPIFIYIVIVSSVILLIIVFLYYEFYYIPSKSSEFKDYKILLDKNDNKGKPYLFSQKFGTDNKGNIVIDEGEKIINIDKFIEYESIDKFDCNSTLNNVTIYMKIKLPYIAPNKKWHSSFRKKKHIIQFGKSPTISYEPINDKIILNILYKDNPTRLITEKIEIDGIIENWMHIVYVIQNRNIFIYLNKKLIKTYLLKGVPILNFNNKTLVKFGEHNNNFNGLVENITLYEKNLTSEQIKNM